jgi:hypothetical protein
VCCFLPGAAAGPPQRGGGRPWGVVLEGRGRFQASMLTVRTQSCLIQRRGLPPSRSPGRGTPIVPSRLVVLSSEILILFNAATPRPTSFAAAAAVGIAARKPAPGDCNCHRHLLRSDQHQHQIETACSRAARNHARRKRPCIQISTHGLMRALSIYHFMRAHMRASPLPQRRPHHLSQKAHPQQVSVTGGRDLTPPLTGITV